MSKPITPDEVPLPKIPDEVIDSFNELITAKWDGYEAYVKQKDVLALIHTKMTITNDEIFSKRYLDVERLYRSVGWLVVYSKPGFNETGEAHFCFMRKQTVG